MVNVRRILVLAVWSALGCGDSGTGGGDASNEDMYASIISLKGQCFESVDCSENQVCHNGLCRLDEAIRKPTYHEDIKPIMQQFCAGCHMQGGIGAFALRNYNDVTTYHKLIEQAIQTDYMPPWTADDGCSDYVNNPRLRGPEKDTFKNWVAAGMPEGDEKPDSANTELFTVNLERVDTEIVLPEPYMPEVVGWPEAYRCHTFEWPETETKYITAFEGIPGYDASVHHAVYFMSPPGELADHYRALQAEDDEPGFACEGGAFLYDLESTWLGTWAPGFVGAFGNYPYGTGIKIEPGAVVSALVHYDLSYNPQPGQLGFRASLEDEVDREAIVVPWLDIDWVGSDKMYIPAGAANVTHAHTGDFWGLAENGPVIIHGSALHMHTRGKNASLSIQRENGEEECLLDIPVWDRLWQFQHVLTEPKEFRDGDQMTISCTWDNLEGKQPTPWMPLIDVFWGDLGLDEMCLGIVFVSFPADREELASTD